MFIWARWSLWDFSFDFFDAFLSCMLCSTVKSMWFSECLESHLRILQAEFGLNCWIEFFLFRFFLLFRWCFDGVKIFTFDGGIRVRFVTIIGAQLKIIFYCKSISKTRFKLLKTVLFTLNCVMLTWIEQPYSKSQCKNNIQKSS